MKTRISLAFTALCAASFLFNSAQATEPSPPRNHPAKPSAPLTKPAVMTTVAKPLAVTTLPKKPPVFTAVSARRRLAPGADASLNPQPIPPGHGPVDPQQH